MLRVCSQFNVKVKIIEFEYINLVKYCFLLVFHMKIEVLSLGSDLETRRRGVTDLVRALCKFFEAKIFEIFSTIIQTFLAEYEQNPASNFVKKDAVYFLVSAIASKTSTERLGATSTSQLVSIFTFIFTYFTTTIYF